MNTIMVSLLLHFMVLPFKGDLLNRVLNKFYFNLTLDQACYDDDYLTEGTISCESSSTTFYTPFYTEEIVTVPPTESSTPQKCGKPKIYGGGNLRIVNGDSTLHGEHPWTVVLAYQ